RPSAARAAVQGSLIPFAGLGLLLRLRRGFRDPALAAARAVLVDRSALCGFVEGARRSGDHLAGRLAALRDHLACRAHCGPVAGALASAFIPVFTSYLAREREAEAWHVASSVMNAVLILLVGFSIVMWIAAPYVVPTFVAPFHDPKQIDLTVDLTRIMLLSPIFMGLSSLTTGILNSYRQFLSSATAPLVYNLVLILFTQFGYPFLGI